MAKLKLRGEGGLFSKIGHRNLIVICAVLLIGAALCVNYFVLAGRDGDIGYGDNGMPDNDNAQNTGGDAGGTEDYFTATALSRQQARDESLEVLQTVLENEAALDSVKEKALEDISRIAKEIEQESNIEALVRAKGFEACVAVINGDAASVIVGSEKDLVASQVAQINEIVYQQTGILPVNVNILCK